MLQIIKSPLTVEYLQIAALACCKRMASLHDFIRFNITEFYPILPFNCNLPHPQTQCSSTIPFIIPQYDYCL